MSETIFAEVIAVLKVNNDENFDFYEFFENYKNHFEDELLSNQIEIDLTSFRSISHPSQKNTYIILDNHKKECDNSYDIGLNLTKQQIFALKEHSISSFRKIFDKKFYIYKTILEQHYGKNIDVQFSFFII